MAAAIGFVEDTAQRLGVPFPMQGTVATTDGQRLWAFRYSSEGRSRSLFRNRDVAVLRSQYPDNPVLHGLSDDTRLVVSEPLGDLRGAWLEVPESSYLVVVDGQEEVVPFAPALSAA
jgi:glutamine amidotransferase